MKVQALKCDICKRDIVLGQQAVKVTLEAQGHTQVFVPVHRVKCLNEVKKMEEALNS